MDVFSNLAVPGPPTLCTVLPLTSTSVTASRLRPEGRGSLHHFTFALFTACSKIVGNAVYRADRTPKESSAQQDRIQIHSDIQYAMTSICKHNLQALIGSRAHVCVVVVVVVVVVVHVVA